METSAAEKSCKEHSKMIYENKTYVVWCNDSWKREMFIIFEGLCSTRKETEMSLVINSWSEDKNLVWIGHWWLYTTFKMFLKNQTRNPGVIKRYTWRLSHSNQNKKRCLSYHTKILNMMTVSFQTSREMNPMDGVGTTRCPSGRKVKLEPYFTPYTNINSRWVRKLNLDNKIIKVLGKNMRHISIISEKGKSF